MISRVRVILHTASLVCNDRRRGKNERERERGDEKKGEIRRLTRGIHIYEWNNSGGREKEDRESVRIGKLERETRRETKRRDDPYVKYRGAIRRNGRPNIISPRKDPDERRPRII